MADPELAALAFRATGTRMPRVPREAALDLRLPLCEDGARRLSALAPLVDRALRGGASLDELEDRLAELTLCMRSSRRAA